MGALVNLRFVEGYPPGGEALNDEAPNAIAARASARPKLIAIQFGSPVPYASSARLATKSPAPSTSRFDSWPSSHLRC